MLIRGKENQVIRRHLVGFLTAFAIRLDQLDGSRFAIGDNQLAHFIDRQPCLVPDDQAAAARGAEACFHRKRRIQLPEHLDSRRGEAAHSPLAGGTRTDIEQHVVTADPELAILWSEIRFDPQIRPVLRIDAADRSAAIDDHIFAAAVFPDGGRLAAAENIRAAPELGAGDRIDPVKAAPVVEISEEEDILGDDEIMAAVAATRVAGGSPVDDGVLHGEDPAAVGARGLPDFGAGCRI